MKPTQGGESKNFIALRRGQGALCAHLYPRRLLDEHNVRSFCPPLRKQGEIGRDGLLDIMTPEGKSLGLGLTYVAPLPPLGEPSTSRMTWSVVLGLPSSSRSETSTMKAGVVGAAGAAGSKWTLAEEPAPSVCWAHWSCCTKDEP